MDADTLALIRAALEGARKEIIWLLAREHGNSAPEITEYLAAFPDARLPEIAAIDTALEKLRGETNG
jgi:hypothetical protein